MRLVRAVLAGLLAVVLAAPAALGQGLLRDEEIERMLRTFTNPILEAAELNPADVHIYIVGDRTLNAFVAGGQNIFVNTGIIVATQDPIELKGVLAHETGHITGGHIARSGEMSDAAMAPFLVTMAAGILAAAAGHGDAAVGLLGSSQYFATMGAFAYSRTQESRADLAGVEFLEKSGQSARGMIAFFDRFREQELFSEARRYPYFSTHPMSSDRVSILRERLEQQEHRDAVDPPEQYVMLDRAKAKIYGFLDKPETTFRRFPEDQQHTEAVYARSIAHYRAGSLDTALRGMEELLRREPENPYFWELKGQMLYEHGQAARAVEPYEHAVRLLPDSALFRIGLAQSLIDTEDDSNLDEAMDQLIAALAYEPDNSFAWYQRSRVHERRGERALAMLATAERHSYGGDAMRALQFAQRARQDLEEGSTEWIRASDIVSTVAAAMPAGESQRRRQ